MLHMFISRQEKNIVRYFRKLASIPVVLMIMVLIVAVTAFSCGKSDKKVESKSGIELIDVEPDVKLVVEGYDGMDAEHLYTRLSEPKLKEGYTFTAGYLQVWGGSRPLMFIQAECERKLKEYGVKVIVYNCNLDTQTQVSQFNQLMSQKVDIIIAYPTQTGSLTQAIKMAKDKGIKVLQINVPSRSTTPLDENVETMIGMPFDLYGYETMKKLVEDHPALKNIGFVGAAIPTDNLPHIVESQRRYAEKLGLKITGQVDAATFTPDTAGAAAQTLISQHPETQAIFCYNEYAALGVSAAMKAAGKQGILCGSANGGEKGEYLPVKNGDIAVQYLNAWGQVGRSAAAAAYKVMTGQKLPARRMLFKGVVVTKDNVDNVQLIE